MGRTSPPPRRNLPYNNGSVFGATDWNWRAESGDWRFFYFDVPEEPASGSHFLVETTWDDDAPYTDLDTLIMGRGENHYQLAGDGAFGAPYILDTVGGSPNTNLGGGVWAFDTASGGAEDIVTGAGPGGPPRRGAPPGRLERQQVQRAVRDDRRERDRQPGRRSRSAPPRTRAGST